MLLPRCMLGIYQNQVSAAHIYHVSPQNSPTIPCCCAKQHTPSEILQIMPRTHQFCPLTPLFPRSDVSLPLAPHYTLGDLLGENTLGCAYKTDLSNLHPRAPLGVKAVAIKGLLPDPPCWGL